MDWGKVSSSQEQTHIINVFYLASKFTWNLIQGCLLISVILLYLLLSIPVFVYRLMITYLVAPYFAPKIGKPVTAISNAYATDLLSQRPPRAVIVAEFVLEGTLPLEEITQQINNNLIYAADNGELRFPELRQYVESWFGFLFWKQDFQFKLENHITMHTLKQWCTDVEAERFANQLIEDQLNTPFPPKKSPWEVQLVQNYNKAGDKKGSTLVVFRFQHAMGDGYAILYALVEALLETPLEKMSLRPQIPVDSKDTPVLSRLIEIPHVIFNFMKAILFDYDYMMSVFHRPKSPWHVSDDNKSWKQLYARSDLIYIDKFKEIKNKLGVSFTGVILSAVSAGVSQCLKWKKENKEQKIEDRNNNGGGGETLECLPTFSTVPLPGHPKGFKNHHAGVVFDIPARHDLKPVDRLIECEQFLAHAKQSSLLPIAVVIWKLLGCQFAFMNAKVFQNPVIPAFLSNFPGPSFQLQFHGRKVLSASFAVGAGSGVAGIGFMVFSYNSTVRIVLTAENAAMTRHELKRMVACIRDEIDTLYEISLKYPKKTTNNKN